MPLFTNKPKRVFKLSELEHAYVLFDKINMDEEEFNFESWWSEEYNQGDEDCWFLVWDIDEDNIATIVSSLMTSPVISKYILWSIDYPYDNVNWEDYMTDSSSRSILISTSKDELLEIGREHGSLEEPWIVDLKEELINKLGNVELVLLPCQDLGEKWTKAFMLKRCYDNLKNNAPDEPVRDVLNEYAN